jgi:hypothetical protein
VVDVGEIAGAVVPYLTRAAAEYGGSVVRQVSDRASDATAEATVGLGRRLLRRLLGSSRSAQVGQAVTELGERPGEADLVDVLSAQVRAAMARDPQLSADLARLLTQAGVGSGKLTVVSGGQGVQVGDQNTQTNLFPPAGP